MLLEKDAQSSDAIYPDKTLHELVQEGIDELDSGGGIPWNPEEFLKEIREEYAQRHRNKKGAA